jgi:hypothetical protein
VRLLVLLALLGGLGYLFGLGSRPIPRPPGVLAPLPPVQEEIPQGERVPLERPPYRLEPVARFHLEARVLGKRVYRADRAADLAPVDLAPRLGADVGHLGPGEDSPLAGPPLLLLRLVRGAPHPPRGDRAEQRQHAPDPRGCGRGEGATAGAPGGTWCGLSGLLVNVQGPQGFYWRTSTVRHDTGAGACEIVWVERLEVR